MEDIEAVILAESESLYRPKSKQMEESDIFGEKSDAKKKIWKLKATVLSKSEFFL